MFVYKPFNFSGDPSIFVIVVFVFFPTPHVLHTYVFGGLGSSGVRDWVRKVGRPVFGKAG